MQVQATPLPQMPAELRSLFDAKAPAPTAAAAPAAKQEVAR